MKVKIICAGMHRSGSTWLFNVLRYIYLEQGYSIYSCFANNDYDPCKDADIHIVKTHAMKKSLIPNTNYILTTCRDLRDIAASAVRRELVEDSIDQIIRYIDNVVTKEYTPWKDISTFEMKYEDMHSNKLGMISKIAKAIYMPMTEPAKVLEKVESLKLPEKKGDFDEATQLHYNHITNGTPRSYHTTLPNSTIHTIEVKHGIWLKNKGYKVT